MRWASLNRPTSHTPNESAFLNFIYGYSLIRDRIDASSRTSIDNWLSSRFVYYSRLGVRDNNWETIRNLLMLNIAYVLNRSDYISTATNAFTNHRNKNYRSDGFSLDFLGRDAFAYHTYDLYFAAQIGRTLYIKKGRAEASRFANYRSSRWVDIRYKPNAAPVLGGSFVNAINFMRPYVMDPTRYKHLEFVKTEYAPDRSRSDYNKPYNSASSKYVFIEVAAIKKSDMLLFIRKTSSGFDKYSDLKFYLNQFGPKV